MFRQPSHGPLVMTISVLREIRALTTSFFFYFRSELAGLLRECLALAPPAIFLALAILNQFTTRAPSLSERKDQKELQELAGKLVESCSQVLYNP